MNIRYLHKPSFVKHSLYSTDIRIHTVISTMIKGLKSEFINDFKYTLFSPKNVLTGDIHHASADTAFSAEDMNFAKQGYEYQTGTCFQRCSS